MPDTPDQPTESSPPALEAASQPAAKRPRPWRRWGIIAATGVTGALLAVLMVTTLVGGDGGDGGMDAADAPTADTGTDDTGTDDTGTDDAAGTSVVEDDAGDATTSPSAPTTDGGTGTPGGFADGQWTVGPDLQPGRYIATGIVGSGCDWARLAGTAGDHVIASADHVGGQAIVDIAASDAAFRSNGCGTWTPYTPPDPPPQTAIAEGDWAVGEQIQPGAYQVARTSSCHWTRASGFGHTTDEVIQTDTSALSLEGPMQAQLAAGERFTNRGCGTWQPSG